MKITLIKKTKPKKGYYDTEYYHEYYIVGNYTVNKRVALFKDGHKYFELHFDRTAVAPNYTPNIWAEVDDSNYADIRIDTNSYGHMQTTELEKLLDAYNHAIEVVNAVEKSDIVKLV